MKISKIMLSSAVALTMLATSCTDNDDPILVSLNLAQTQIGYSEDNVWDQVATNTPLQSQNFNFSHQGSMSDWGLVWFGFTPARCTETADPGSPRYLHQFDVITGGGTAGVGTPYLVACWDTMETEDTELADRSLHITYLDSEGDKLPFTPQSVKVTNTCYVYYSVKSGDDFTAPFDEGDRLTVIAHGVHADGTETSVSFNLADFDSELLINQWTTWSLSGLGEVTDIYFTMESTDVSQWGMNTPAYFAMDAFSAYVELPND